MTVQTSRMLKHALDLRPSGQALRLSSGLSHSLARAEKQPQWENIDLHFCCDTVFARHKVTSSLRSHESLFCSTSWGHSIRINECPRLQPDAAFYYADAELAGETHGALVGPRPETAGGCDIAPSFSSMPHPATPRTP